MKQIHQIVEHAQQEAIANSYVCLLSVICCGYCLRLLQFTEFEIDREFVGRVVGSQGSNVNKLREQLNVRVDVFDDAEEREKDKDMSKKKKSPPQMSRLKVRWLFKSIDMILS